MRRTMVCAAILCFGASASRAADITPQETMDVLVGNTWSGVNASGDKFWFWHEGAGGAGTFAAKFKKNHGGAKNYSGSWAISGEQVCWAWDGWKTFCYVDFAKDGATVTMTRTDGEVHSGSLTLGNTEGL